MDQFIEFLGANYILTGLWVVLFVALVYSFIAGAVSKVREIGTHEATMLMNKEDAVVLDIRSQADFRKGHILGAKQVNADNLNKGETAEVEKYKGKPIIVVCAMGMSAKRTASQLNKAGFSQVTVLKGGMNSWTSASLPIAK